MVATTRIQTFRRGHYLLWLVLPIIFLATIISAKASFPVQNPDLQHAFAYISPQPDAKFVSAETTIAVRPSWDMGSKLYETIAFTVSGTQSGTHLGQTILADDQHTILFNPDKPFLANETVFVTIDLGKTVPNLPRIFRYSFNISSPIPQLSEPINWRETGGLPTHQIPSTNSQSPALSKLYKTAPADLPGFTVTAVDQNWGQDLGDGYLFMAYFDYANFLASNAYLLILDNNGEPVYYDRLHPLDSALDFKKQPNGLLTYFNPLPSQRKFFALDNHYDEVDSFTAGNGYQTDLHDLQILDNGNALLMIYGYHLVDMSQLVPGGHPEAVITSCILQELDTAKNVIFEWHSLDHISILDSNQILTNETIDYIHCNSVAQDHDGNLLISSRHLDEVTKINRNTGDVIWRLGGSQNQFAFTNDDGFFHQHDARRLPNGHITLYDNGNLHNPPYSRGVEYHVNETEMTATRIAEFRHEPDVFGQAMGNNQRLPSGNTVVGWGTSSDPILTEFASDGSVALTLSATGTNGSYRAFRFPWTGYPTWSPALVAETNESNVDLYFSWNGATEIAAYQIYGGQDLNQLAFLATVAKQGFESTFTYSAATDDLYYFQVMAIDKDGQPTQLSNLASAMVGGVQIHLPLISNGN